MSKFTVSKNQGCYDLSIRTYILYCFRLNIFAQNIAVYTYLIALNAIVKEFLIIKCYIANLYAPSQFINLTQNLLEEKFTK